MIAGPVVFDDVAKGHRNGWARDGMGLPQSYIPRNAGRLGLSRDGAAGVAEGGRRTMPWTRLDPAGVIQHLRAEWDRAAPGDEALAERALAQLREELLSGRCIAVQDGQGRTFIGTPDEAAEHMMASADR